MGKSEVPGEGDSWNTAVQMGCVCACVCGCVGVWIEGFNVDGVK